jgi:hypothetical protein
MTERERWVVYPLLFLALGAALRDKLFDRTTSRVIVCQELHVVDEDITGQRPPRTLARIGRADAGTGGPSIGFLGVNGVVRVDGSIQAKSFSFFPGGSWEALLRGLQSLRGAPAAGGAEMKQGREPGRDDDAVKSPPARPLNGGRGQEPPLKQ